MRTTQNKHRPQVATCAKFISGEGGIRTTGKSPKEIALLELRAAKSDALAKHDPDLAMIVETWPALPPAIRTAILALARAAK